MGEDNSVLAAIARIAAEMDAIQAKIDANVRLEQHEIDRFDGIHRELSKLREQWIVEECQRGTPQWRVAELAGVSPGRVSQIMALYKGRDEDNVGKSAVGSAPEESPSNQV